MYLRRLIRLRHTLTFRLTLWYAVIFTISSCVAFLFFYMLINSVIMERTDQDLLDQAGKFSKLLKTNGIDAVKRVAIVESQAAGEKKIFFRILSQNGQTFFSSNISYWEDIGVSTEAVKALIQGSRNIFDTMVINERKFEVRILYSVLGPGMIIQLGQSMESHKRFMEAFERIFIITMTFLIMLAALVGWFMSRRALSGLEEVTGTARKISDGDLEKRVPVNQTGDEIDQLATTFNQMLDRIQALVSGIKEMSDNIAHDLKSPITRIRGIAEVTLTEDHSLEGYARMASSTIEECDRILDIINTMLFISKTEAGVGQIQPEKVDMSKVLQDACELFQPMAEDSGVTVNCSIQDGNPVYADMRMMQRMTANLLDNAIRYSSFGGRVNLSIHTDRESRVVISVNDTGIGISEKDLPHIFERFYRCDPSRSQAGTGLGLSLARAIAVAHHGDISVTSEQGKGSTFTVTIPACRDSRTISD
ncbi:MAG: HAMP domain-containing protein [Deltaproteobacteria bacterium]|nr:HAMP domain-containing protein [Deltaproteobacteria bacterium]